MLPLPTNPDPQTQLRLLEVMQQNPLRFLKEIEQLLQSEYLQVSLAAAEILLNLRRLNPLALLNYDRRPELRRLAAQSLPSYYQPLSRILTVLTSYGVFLRQETDSEVKRQVMVYLQQAVYMDFPEQQWPSFWRQLFGHMVILKDDPEIGRQASELCRYTEAQYQPTCERLLAQPGSRRMISELAQYGDARALPVLEQLVTTDAAEENFFGGDNNGAGGLPQPYTFPLKPHAQEAIVAIRARLEPPLMAAAPAKARKTLTPALAGIFRSALERELGNALPIPKRLQFNRVYVINGEDREEDRRRSRQVRFLIRREPEPHLDFFDESEDYSIHRRINAQGTLIYLEDYRGQWGKLVYPDDPERTKRERIEVQAHNERVRGLLVAKGLAG